MNAEQVQKLVVVANEVHRRRLRNGGLPVVEVFLQTGDRIAVVEDALVLRNHVVELNILLLAVLCVLPLVAREPGVSAADDGGFGLHKEAGAAGAAERNLRFLNSWMSGGDDVRVERKRIAMSL